MRFHIDLYKGCPSALMVFDIGQVSVRDKTMAISPRQIAGGEWEHYTVWCGFRMFGIGRDRTGMFWLGDDVLINAMFAEAPRAVPGGKPVTAQDDAPARAAKPAIDLVKKAESTATPGSTITFKLRVTNVGNLNLAPVEVRDSQVPGCDRRSDRLAIGAHQQWTCKPTAPQSGQVDNTATTTGTRDVENPTEP